MGLKPPVFIVINTSHNSAKVYLAHTLDTSTLASNQKQNHRFKCTWGYNS